MPDATHQKGTDNSPRSRPATVDDAAVRPAGKKLPQEDIDKSCARLHTTQRKTRELPPLVEKRTLTKDTEEASVRRLYEQAMQLQQRRAAELEKKVHAQSGLVESKKMEETEVTDAVNRLYQQHAEQKKRSAQSLATKYAPEPERKKLPSPAAQQESNTRMCDEAAEKARSSKARLYDKYVTQQLPKMAKRSAAELTETAKRLYVVNGK